MKKLFTLAAVIVALGATSASAQPWRNDRNDDGRYGDKLRYSDDRGDYHWEVVERRVWVPERRVRGIFGTRVEPGHYEIRQERIRVYDRDRRGYKNIPYGQAKKRWDRRDDRDRCDNREHRHDRDGRWYH